MWTNDHIHCWLGRSNDAATLKTSLAFNIWLPYETAISLLHSLSQRNANLPSLHKILYRNVHGSFIHNSPRLKTAKISFNGLSILQNTSQNWIPLSPQNEWTTDTHNNLDEFPGNYCEGEKLISQSCIFEMTKFLKTVSRSVVGTGWWRGRVWEGRVCCCIDKRATGRILVVMDLHWGGEYTNLHVIKSYITKYIHTHQWIQGKWKYEYGQWTVPILLSWLWGHVRLQKLSLRENG